MNDKNHLSGDDPCAWRRPDKVLYNERELTVVCVNRKIDKERYAGEITYTWEFITENQTIVAAMTQWEHCHPEELEHFTPTAILGEEVNGGRPDVAFTFMTPAGKDFAWERAKMVIVRPHNLEERKIVHEYQEKRTASFCDFAFKNLEVAVMSAIAGGPPPDWPSVSRLFYDLETAFDPVFYACKSRIEGESDYDFQKRVDKIRMRRQQDMAKALLKCEPELVRRYAEILRDVKKPAGLADVEKRTAFVETVEEAQGKREKTGAAPGALTDTATRFRLLNQDWKQISVDGQLFDLQDRKQIKNALRFLYEKGCTSKTGKRATVKAVCRAAGQKSQEPNLHAIFHVMKQPAPPTLDYDHLYDLAIDCQRGSGVLLKV